ncbi:MspA family porin [Mycobacterium sp. CBMA271]|uniref:MspA family porin n=1 Tax=unclassified Mycobacteroides TaxID=2618759 RepID=UPI0012DC8EA6|nr:MspA family protein [Mycobacteroides sp. CBMA 326]MUM22968.1 MspA family porin [Mycobacteroides sp. CBMA 271]
MAVVPRVGAVMAMVATICMLGTATASADPVSMAAQTYTKISRDGWTLMIRIDHESINSIPNLAEASNSREAFVTFDATAIATGGSAPITDSLFIAGYQLGCQTDVSSGLQIGGTGGLAGNVGYSGGPQVGGAGGVAGFAQTILQPGVITDLPLANMALSDGGKAMLDVDNLHVKADACGGDVTIRSYVYLRISTAAAHTEFAIYGDPMKI